MRAPRPKNLQFPSSVGLTCHGQSGITDFYECGPNKQIKAHGRGHMVDIQDETPER